MPTERALLGIIDNYNCCNLSSAGLCNAFLSTLRCYIEKAKMECNEGVYAFVSV